METELQFGSCPQDRQQIQDLAAEALRGKRDYLQELLERYRQRQAQRKLRGIPVLSFCGPGRSGKDVAGEYLAQRYQLDFTGSTSHIVCPLVAYALRREESDCFAQRHQERGFWKLFCDALRKEDASLIARLALADGDILSGVRGEPEVRAVRDRGIADLLIWVRRPQVPADPTMDYTDDYCDLVIGNEATLSLYYERLDRLAAALKIPRRKGHHEHWT